MMTARCVTTQQYNSSMHRLQTWNNLLLLVFASHRIARSFVQISDFPWKFIVSSLQQYMNSKIPCSLSILTIFRTLIPFQNCYKIEMTYFIYNWKFRVVCMLMSERRRWLRWRRLDCTMWPACASDRLHVLVIWASGRSLYILTKLLLLGSCYK